MASVSDDHFAPAVLVPSPPAVTSDAVASHPSRSSASITDAANVEPTMPPVAADAGPAVASASRVGTVDDPAQAGHERVELGGGGALDRERREAGQARDSLLAVADSSEGALTLPSLS